MKKSVLVFVSALELLLCAGAGTADPGKAFLPAGSLAIDWNIGLELPFVWPPIPTGGPGLRYSFTDDLAAGFQIEVSPFFQRGFAANAFSTWRFWNPANWPLSGATSVSFLLEAMPDSRLWVSPRVGVCLGFGAGSGLSFAEGYAACDLTVFIIDAPVPPFVSAAASLGAIFPSVGSLFLEYRLSDIGIYSSVTRTSVGSSSLAVGMLNAF